MVVDKEPGRLRHGLAQHHCTREERELDVRTGRGAATRPTRVQLRVGRVCSSLGVIVGSSSARGRVVRAGS